MRLDELKNKQVVIFGWGREGKASYEVLIRQGIKPIITDEQIIDRQIIDHSDFLSFEKIDFSLATILLKSPGIPLKHPAVLKARLMGAIITSATNIFFSERKGRGTIIGITGTKGKSTTVALTAAILETGTRRVVRAGNIGEPMLKYLDAPEETIFVLELSSYMLADLEIGPDISVILNVFEEHMDWHGSVAEYQAAKLNLIQIMTKDDLLIYAPECKPVLKALVGTAVQTKLMVALDQIPAKLLIRGEHNRENARAALSVALELGIELEPALEVIKVFKPLPHRLEEIMNADDGGGIFVNDSISTTPQSTLEAIKVYSDQLRVIILGGFDRGYDFSVLVAELIKRAEVLVLILPGGERLRAEFEVAGRFVKTVPDLAVAVAEARAVLGVNEVCLLSPAGPSYGQFKNFEERGEKFRKAVALV